MASRWFSDLLESGVGAGVSELVGLSATLADSGGWTQIAVACCMMSGVCARKT